MLIKIKDGWFISLQFLTSIPVKKEISWDEARLKWSVRFFPAIGLLLGLLLMIQAYLLQTYTPFSNLMISFWLLFFSILFSGGLHLDGWMDCSDAVFSYRDRERKLEIMSDSNVGAFAVLSVLFLLSFRFLFIYESIELSSSTELVWLMIIPFLTRTAAAGLLIFGKPAKETGLATIFKKNLTKADFSFLIAFYLIVVSFLFKASFLPLLILSISALIFYIGSNWFYNSQFGGITGDTIGALIEGEETFLWFVLWLLHYYVMV